MPPYRPDPPFHDEMSLGAARVLLRELVAEDRKSVDCPCCSQSVTIFDRRITSSAARRLITAYVRYGLEPFHGPTRLNTTGLGGEWARLAYWDLIADLGGRREDGGRAGWWRVTSKGEAFVRGEVRVPKFVTVFDRKPTLPWGEPVSIQDALKHPFDLRELLARIASERVA